MYNVSNILSALVRWTSGALRYIVDKISMSVNSNNTKNSGNNANMGNIGSQNQVTQIINNNTTVHLGMTPTESCYEPINISNDSKKSLSEMMDELIKQPSVSETGSLVLDDVTTKLAKLNIDLVKILAFSFMFSVKKIMTYKTFKFLHQEFGMVMAHFKDLKITRIDLRYLESVGCGKYDRYSRVVWRKMITFDPQISPEDLLASIPDSQVIQNIMDGELSSFSPSPTGIAIAIEYLNRNGFTMEIEDWIV